MYTKLIDQIENAFYEGFTDKSFRKHGKGYVGPLEIKDEEDFYIVKKVIVDLVLTKLLRMSVKVS